MRNREELYADSLLFIDDATLVASAPHELQLMMDNFSNACFLFYMTIMAVIEQFCYLGSTVSNNLLLDAEINKIIVLAKRRLCLGSSVLEFKIARLTTKAKMYVFQSSILSTLLYRADLENLCKTGFYMRCLHNILGISLLGMKMQSNKRARARNCVIA